MSLEARPATIRGRVLALMAGVMLSTGWPLIRLVEEATEWQFLTYRALAVALVLGALLSRRGVASALATVRSAGWTAVIGGLFLACGFTGFVFAITHSTVANVLFLLSAAPFFAAILGLLVLGERVGRWTWLAMAGAMAGVGIMVGEGVAEGDLFGDLAALGAAAAFAAFSVALRRGRDVDMAPAVWFAGVFSAGASATMALTQGTGLAIPLGDLAAASAYGGIGVGGGLILYTASSREVPAAELTLLSLTEVVLGPIWVWLGFGEVPSTLTLVGGAVLLGAVVVQALAPRGNG
jgi:drug/metabolite transporter (DMT)-like permease